MILRKNNKKINYIMFVILIVFLSLFISICFINFFSKRVNLILVPVAEVKLKKKINIFINDIVKNINVNKKLINIVKNKNDEIILINYEEEKIKNIITNTTILLTNEINYLVNNSNCIIDDLPFGLIFNTTFLNNIGPRIKINYKFIDDVVVSVETEVKPYGLNNAYVEVRLCIENRILIYLPFVSKELTIVNKIPISMNIVQGNVPSGYINSYK